ncbi:four-helix bundle copper-binding protein [Aureimonas ureilytica]|uniref:four-helix bundle copper-binding protein n=1 Tax=Aureimonas ureilytica TaxID=401562 RepID=UPI003CE850A7
MNAMNHDMSACIKACLDCYSTCLSTATHHCLEAGGKHTEPKHFRLMLACAEMCRASAQIMLTGSPAHRHSCAACAEICAACAADCERVGDMERCVAACHACAEECRKMAA